MSRRGALLLLTTLGACAAPPGAVPADLGRRMSPTLASIETEVFGPLCARPACHAGPIPEGLFSLVPGRAYANLVGVRSQQIPDLMRVEPGSPERSYLVRKLRGDRIVGEPMPNQGGRLPPEAIAVIERWIDAGAPER